MTLLFALLSVGGPLSAEIVLTPEKMVEMALEYNRQLLSAQKEIDRSRGEIISARAGALPKLSLDGSYTRNLTEQYFFIGDEKVPISRNNDINLTLSLTQPLYVGGKVGAALKVAKIYQDYSEEVYQQVEAEITFNAQSIFYQAVLAESNLDVLKKSYEQLSYNLEVAEKNFSQGMISEYELLRARVEKLNLEPQLISAESERSVSRKRLKSFIGLELDESIKLVSDYKDTAVAELPGLDSLVTIAMNNRPEIKQARLQKKGRSEAVQIARGDWLFPTISLNTQYHVMASSNDFKIYSNELSKNWTASLFLTIPLFDGARTIGEVRKAKVDYYQAVLQEQQTYDDIRLEVEQAHDNFQQAVKALHLQAETIAQAEEGMRIADLRYESGIGTQLEVLSAQTALTQARFQLARTVFNLRLARAALEKATGMNIK